MKVYFIGAGPGGADLITVRGLEILRQADVIIYDYLVDKKLLEEARDGAELVCCDTLGKNQHSDGFAIHQERINKLIVEKVKEGKRVVRLKNGDPSIFSRLSQELDVLVKNRIDFEIVPGVTAASAAATFSGIPLTDRKFASSVVFATGHEDPTKTESFLDWKSLSGCGTIVLYMGLENLPKIVKELIKVGKAKTAPCAIIKDATLLTQRLVVGTLADITQKAKAAKMTPPVIIIIGEVVRFEKRFNRLRRTKRVLYTGISKERFFADSRYFHLPLIKLVATEEYGEFDSYLRGINEFDWIVFTSRYGVEYFFERLYKINYDSRMLDGIRIAAIGNSTNNRLLNFGIIADLVPMKESSEGLLEAFKKVNIKGKNIFLPRSDISDKGLNRGLEDLGAKVEQGIAYRNARQEGLPNLDLNFFNEIYFTSPSTVRSFKARYKRVPRRVKVRCIGDVTLKEARRFGFVS